MCFFVPYFIIGVFDMIALVSPLSVPSCNQNYIARSIVGLDGGTLIGSSPSDRCELIVLLATIGASVPAVLGDLPAGYVRISDVLWKPVYQLGVEHPRGRGGTRRGLLGRACRPRICQDPLPHIGGCGRPRDQDLG